MTSTDTPGTTYDRLKAPFDQTFTDVRGGVEITYVTGEQVATRLNDVLGVSAWSFRILEHNINAEADEVWVLGELIAKIDGESVVRQQFGSQKLKRARATGVILDIGFDQKGAATDAMKKCASLIGVGLYLSEKHATAAGRAASTTPARQQQPRQQAAQPSQKPAAKLTCHTCHAELTETTFKDGTSWTVEQLAAFGREKFGAVLCYEHCRAAKEARKSREAA